MSEHLFHEHPDLNEHDSEACDRDGQLLSSLIREVETDVEEALRAGIGDSHLFTDFVTQCAISGLLEFRQNTCGRILHQISRGRLRFTEMELNTLGGFYAEAFLLGAKFIAEKHGWNEFRKTVETVKPEPGPPDEAGTSD